MVRFGASVFGLAILSGGLFAAIPALGDPATAIKLRLYRIERGLFGDCRPVGEGVMEMRVDVGPGYRGYFFRSGRRVVLLLCGGDKRTQSGDIEKAKQFRREYEKRTHGTLGSG